MSEGDPAEPVSTEPIASVAPGATADPTEPIESGTPSAPADPPEPIAPKRPRGRQRVASALWVVLLAVVAFMTGLLLFNNLVMPRFIHSNAEVAVPDLTSLTYEQAEQALRALGLTLSRSGERFDPSVPRGFVLSQDPPADTPVRGRKRVMVVVSLGEEFSSVPSLFGESLRSARFLLQRSGLRVSGVTYSPSEEVGEGLVASTDPPAETVLPRNGAVALLISTGTGEESYVMPDLLGREILGVRRHLESLGYHVVTPPAAPSVGAIVFQDPAAGSRIGIDTQINLQATGRIIR